MKLRPVTELDKRNMATSKKIDNGIMLASCDVYAIFPFFGKFGATRKPDSVCVVFKMYFFININLLSYKN